MIKKIFNPGNYSRNIDLVLLILRLVAGIFMLTHGMGKFSKLFGDGPIKFADPMGVGATVSLALAVFSEVLCSILLILGLATRYAAIPLLFTMLVAALVIHVNDGFGKQELPLMYSTMYLAIAISGAGKFSVDKLIFHKLNRIETTN